MGRADQSNSAGLSDNDELIVVIDDDLSLREAIRLLLRSLGHEVECCGSVEEFFALFEKRRPACLVLDVRLPGISGLELQRRLRASQHPIPIVFLTGHADIPISVQAMKEGALEFLTKPFREQDLLDAIQRALEQHRMSVHATKANHALSEAYSRLTAREQSILHYVAQGMVNKQIAAELGLSEVTIKVHRTHIMRKMGARTLADLIRMNDSIASSGLRAQRR